jgi:uncharacterized membrane protein
MSNSRVCGLRKNEGSTGAINVGDTERTMSVLAGGFVLLHGLSKLSLSTIVTAVAGGALIYRGLTGHCSVYQALESSTPRGLADDAQGGRRTRPLHQVTDASLAATSESPSISSK